MRDVIRWAAKVLVVAAVLALAAQPAALAAPQPTVTPAAPDEPEVIPPRVLAKTQTAPVYPPAALAGRFGGEVEVKAMVSPEGEVIKVDIVECTHPNLGFEAATADAVREWKFHPATQAGEAIPYELNFRMAFRWRGEGRAYVSSGDLAGARNTSSTSDASPAQSRLGGLPESTRGRGPGGL